MPTSSAYLFRASSERTCCRLRCFGKMSVMGIRSGRGGKVGIYSPQAGRSPTTSFLPRAAHSRDPSSKPKLLRQPPPLTTRRRLKFRRSNWEPYPCRWGCTNLRRRTCLWNRWLLNDVVLRAFCHGQPFFTRDKLYKAGHH